MSFPRLSHILPAGLLILSLVPASPANARNTRSETIKAGKYMALLADCGACHTIKGKPDYAGGLAFAIPTGVIYATNITPDLTYGIGNYSEADFSKAVREGIRKDGKSLYPAMPYPSYARLSDADIHALYTYFKYGVTPVHQPAPEEKIIWPLNARWPLAIWRHFFAPNPQKAQKETNRQSQNKQIERGAYLAEGAGHCGACHTPRGLSLEERTLIEDNTHLFLSGGQNMEGWDAPTLRQDQHSGLKNWTHQDLEHFLKTGKSSKGQVFGAMTDVIQKSTSRWKDEDIQAISAFLLSLKPLNEEETQWRVPASLTNKKRAAFAKGKQIYIDRCAACHGPDGKGYGTAFPPLAGNPIVMSPNTASLIHIVEKGATVPAFPPENPSSFSMPGFSDMLSDVQISEVLTYIRSAWGNNADSISIRKVGKTRRSLPPETLTASPLN